MTEAELMRKIQIEVTKFGGRVFRNNVGMFSTSTGSAIRTGLCVGSADLIGWFPYDGHAVFLAIEVKTPKGRVRDEQKKFLHAVINAGGIAFIARSVEDVRNRFLNLKT